MPFEVKVQGPNEVSRFQRKIHLHPGCWVLDEPLLFEHIKQRSNPSQLRAALRACVPALPPLAYCRNADADDLGNVRPSHTALASEFGEQPGDRLLGLLEGAVSQIEFTFL